LDQTDHALVSGEIADFRYGVDVNTLEHRPITELALNEVGHVALTLNQSIAYDPYRINPATGAFIIIDRMTNNTVGAGVILEQSERGSGDRWGQQPVVKENKGRLSLVTTDERERRLGQKAVTVFLTGLHGSGKSRIAYELERRLFDSGFSTTVLYGQNMRQGLARDLGFSPMIDRKISAVPRRWRRYSTNPDDLHLRLRRAARSRARKGAPDHRSRKIH
jgi:bifunctional enzyme CysN/CysC